MKSNPFEQIDQRLDQIESLIQEIKRKQNEKPSSKNPSQRLTRKQIRAEYSVSLSTIHKLMREGELPFSKIGRKTIFRREDVEACFS